MSDTMSGVKRVIKRLRKEAKSRAVACSILGICALLLTIAGNYFGLLDSEFVSSHIVADLFVIPISIAIGWMLGIMEVYKKLVSENIV